MTTKTIALVVTAAVCAVPVDLAESQAPMPAGITRAVVLENDTVLVARLAFAPGAREDVHTHPFSAVVVQVGAASVDMQLGRARTTGRRDHGFVEFIASAVPHAAANAGTHVFEVVTVAIKPDRHPVPARPAAPTTAAPEGVTRADVLDNEEVSVTRLGFAPEAREPLHDHPFDLAVVVLTPGRLELRLRSETSAREYTAGDVVFVPRDVPHAVSNVGGMPVDVLAVAIK